MSTLGSMFNLDGAADLLFIEALCGIRPLNVPFCLDSGGVAAGTCAIAETLRCCDAE